ncbi:MAG TPA: Ig-like domain-containing protein [Polyangiaceae bacterium]|nr:Ig-like domain-containing protein [Polyangiaceae bacterium]
MTRHRKLRALARALAALGLLAPLVVTLAPSRDAHACSVPLACGFTLPATSTRVPLNTPALGVGNHGTNVPFLVLVDEAGATVPATREAIDGSTFLRPTAPLKENATYTLTVGCNTDGGVGGLDGGAEPSVKKITAGAPTPLPTSLGRLKLLEARDEAISTPGQADCQGLRRAKIARVRWTPDPSLAAFSPMLLVTKNGAPDFYAGNNGSGNDSLKVELGSGTSPLEFDVKLKCLALTQQVVLSGGVFGAPALPALEVDVPACITSPGDPGPVADEGGCAVGGPVGARPTLVAAGLTALALAAWAARRRRAT